MWESGTISFEGQKYDYEMKRLDYNHWICIDEGKIVKLFMYRGDKEIVNYQRGWDIYLENTQDEEALEQLLREFN